MARPIVPGAASLLAVLLLTRANVVANAKSIAIITAIPKSTRAVRWSVRSLLMREFMINEVEPEVILHLLSSPHGGPPAYSNRSRLIPIEVWPNIGSTLAASGANKISGDGPAL